MLDALMHVYIIEDMSIDSLDFAKIIADETRQAIMEHLCCVWLSVNDLVDKLEVKQPTVSHHLKLLEAANLVLVRQEGRQRFYSLNQEQLTFCCGQLIQKFAPDYSASIVLASDSN